MSSNFKISIPKPCHEDWNAMSTVEKGRFCDVCRKKVIDFTRMNDVEVQSVISENSDTKICGRFYNNQLSTFNLKIPQKLLTQKRSFHKAFLLALFITMGSTLFSCKNDQNQTLGEVEVVSRDTITNINDGDIEAGEATNVKGEVNVNKHQPKPKINEIKFHKKSEDGQISMGMPMIEPPIDIEDSVKVKKINNK